MPKTAPVRRRARGEVPHMILSALADSDVSMRWTPYGLSQALDISPGSATSAVKKLIEQGRVVCYGESPLVIGRRDD